VIPRPPLSDDVSHDVLDDAVTALADRRGLSVCDDTAPIHLLASPIDQAERWLPHAVLGAPEEGATWQDIATLLTTSPHEAELRYDSPIADSRWPWRYPGDDATPTDINQTY
jgi:hypothetical protein